MILATCKVLEASVGQFQEGSPRNLWQIVMYGDDGRCIHSSLSHWLIRCDHMIECIDGKLLNLFTSNHRVLTTVTTSQPPSS